MFGAHRDFPLASERCWKSYRQNPLHHYAKAPADVEIQKELAYCYHKKNDYKNALKFYDLALKNAPDDYDLKYNKALVLHADKSYLSAIELYKSLITEKESEEVQNNLKESSKELKVVKEALESLLIVAPYLELDKEKMVGKYTRIPDRNELNKEITESQIVEFYNRKL